jgi:hypothetical protein
MEYASYAKNPRPRRSPPEDVYTPIDGTSRPFVYLRYNGGNEIAVGDLNAGRKLTREALWRCDARLARCLWTGQRSWSGPLLRIDSP